MALETYIDAYNLVFQDTSTADTALGTTGFYRDAVPSGMHVDLLSPNNGGGGSETRANNIALTIESDSDADSVWGIMIYGAVDGGSWQPITLLSATIGTALSASGIRYADAISVSEYNLTTILCPTVPANTIATVGLDVTGFRYLKFLMTTTPNSSKTVYVYGRIF